VPIYFIVERNRVTTAASRHVHETGDKEERRRRNA
jgi:hypothetical protein